MLKLAWEILPLFLMIALYGVGGLELTKIRAFDPLGSAGYPLFLACTAAILAIPVVTESYRKRGEVALSDLRKPVTKVVSIIILTALYLLLMEPAGFILLTPLYIVSLLLALGTRKAKTLIVVSIAATAVLYVVFGLFFGVLLPLGPIGAFV